MPEMDYSGLYGKLKQNRLTQKEVAARLGISANSLYLKLSGQSPFRTCEIVQMCQILHIDGDEIGKYFFSPKG